MFDLWLFQFINGFANRSVLADWFVVVVAEYLPYLTLIALAVLYVRVPEWRERVRIFLISAFAFLISRGFIFEVIHYFVSRPRPFVALQLVPLFNEASYAFPSSHAIVLTTFACIAFLISKKWGVWFFVFALLNGVARIYSGVHWPTDVLGGIAIALISFYIASRVFPENSGSHKKEI